MEGVCSFCGEGPVVAWFEGPDFREWVDAPDKVRADEAWLACGISLRLVEKDDREALVERGEARPARRGEPPAGTETFVRDLFEQFWAGR